MDNTKITKIYDKLVEYIDEKSGLDLGDSLILAEMLVNTYKDAVVTDLGMDGAEEEEDLIEEDDYPTEEEEEEEEQPKKVQKIENKPGSRPSLVKRPEVIMKKKPISPMQIDNGEF